MNRPAALLPRADLRARSMQSGRGDYWTVQDPVSLRSYWLRPEEYFILQLVDGRRSLAEITRLFEREFAPRKLVPQHLQSFLGMLHREGLIVADADGQGDVLLRRRHQTRRDHLWRALANPLAIRLPGFDPNRFLEWLLPKCVWLFSPVCICLASLLVLSAIGLLLIEWKTVSNRIAGLPTFFQAGNVAWFALAIGVSKVLHELGHALTCKRLGSRCHEMGIMFLVFVPCLYCNVSDASLLPSKWQRMAVTAAGVGVELVLAAACLWVWWFSAPGPLNSFCLAMTIVCSVNTLAINGNPLLRFDGYYLLGDFLEIPNLGQTAQQAWSRCWDRLWLGPQAISANREPQWFLLGYGIASFLFRWAVLLAILVGVYATLEPLGLAVLAHLLSFVLLFGAVLGPMYRGTKARLERTSIFGPSSIRRTFIVSLWLLAAMGLLFLPVVRSVQVPVHLEASDAERVYVTVPGIVNQAAVEADTVRQGQVLARLENLDFERTTRALCAEHDEQELHVRNLRRLRSVVAEADTQLSSAEAVLDDLRERLQQRQAQMRQLTLVAPRAGTILPPPATPASDTANELESWHGKPIDANNDGAYLAQGTWFCSVGNPAHVEAVALIEQGQIQHLRVGQPVRLRFDLLPGEMVKGKVVELAEADFSRDDSLHETASREGDGIAGGTYYKARIALDKLSIPVRIGSRGRARITISAEAVATRCYRYLRRTFSLLL